jgi:hypothetical protein
LRPLAPPPKEYPDDLRAVLGDALRGGTHHAGKRDDRERGEHKDHNRRRAQKSRDERNRNENQKRVQDFHEPRLRTGI